MIKDGIIVAMQTPMYDNEEVNYDQLRCQVDRFVNGGLHGLFCLGTNGESFMLDKAEKIKIMEVFTSKTRVDCLCTQARGVSAPVIRLSCPRLPKAFVSIVCR